jgi:hypothetical protein
MKKQDLVAQLAEINDITKKDAEGVLNSLIDIIVDKLKENGKIQISGLGTLSVHTRKNLVNPKTKEIMKGKEVKYVSFKQSANVKNSIN